MTDPEQPQDSQDPTRLSDADLAGETTRPEVPDGAGGTVESRRLGDFELIRELGRGGMGVVYEARQVSLKRHVALKVLPPALGMGPQAKQRFEREAQAAAKLHHTNIVPVHAIGEHDGHHYYAMDLIEGQSLDHVVRSLAEDGSNPVLDETVSRAASELPQQPLPPAEPQPVATHGEDPSTRRGDTSADSRRRFDAVAEWIAEVADGLDYAHGRGVIHRDIKPANLMLSTDGTLRITDFGLARIVQEPGMTVSGSFLGTPAYMSPEQIAAGRVKLDHRTDIYSLGAVLYELLTLERPFGGESREEVLTAIMAKYPRPPRKCNARIPRDLETICLKALEKDPDRRYATAGKMAQDLRRYLKREPIEARPAGPLRRAWSVVRRHPTVAVGLGAFLLAAVVISVVAWRYEQRAASTIDLGSPSQLTLDPGLEIDPALSADGSMLAYSAGSGKMSVYLLRRETGRSVRLTATELGNCRFPKWAPDEKEIGVVANSSAVYAIPTEGGPPRRIIEAEAGERILGFDWSPDGKRVAYAVTNRAGGMELRIRVMDGQSDTKIAELPGIHSVAWSPDGRWIACVSGNVIAARGNEAPSAIHLVSPETEAAIEIAGGESLNTSPAWGPDSRMLYFVSDREGSDDVYRVAINARGYPREEPRVLLRGVGVRSIAMSRDGRFLAYSSLSQRMNVRSIPIPESSMAISASAAKSVTVGNQRVETMSVSRDGHWIIFSSDRAGSQDLYRMRLDVGEPERLTRDPGHEFFPVWSPNGTELSFSSARTGNSEIYVMSDDGGSLQQVTFDDRPENLPDWSPDGQQLVVCDPDGLRLVRRAPATGKWTEVRRLTDEGCRPRWSPDGSLIAYLLAVQGASRYSFVDTELVALAVHDGSTQTLIRGGPSHDLPMPLWLAWSPEGKVLYFLAYDAEQVPSIWSVPRTGGTARLLVQFDAPAEIAGLDSDGTHFYFPMVENEADIHMVEVLD